MALPFLRTSLEGPKLLRRVEQSLLPGGGANDCQPAQTAARRAGDDLAELLGKPDNDALGPADVGEPVRVPVPHFADELGPVGEHARYESVDVVDGEHDATEA